MHLTIPPSLREATIAATVDAIQRLKDRRAAKLCGTVANDSQRPQIGLSNQRANG